MLDHFYVIYLIDCHNDSIAPDDIKSDGLVKFVCSEMMTEQRWIHIALVWAKGMLKNSAVTLYINGKQIAVQKVNISIDIHLNRMFHL